MACFTTAADVPDDRNYLSTVHTKISTNLRPLIGGFMQVKCKTIFKVNFHKEVAYWFNNTVVCQSGHAGLCVSEKWGILLVCSQTWPASATDWFNKGCAIYCRVCMPYVKGS